MGGMIAAEMAAARAESSTARSCLIDPLGLWLDDAPDHRHLLAAALRVPAAAVPRCSRGHRAAGRGGVDFDDTAAIQRFLIGNTAGSAPPARSCSRSPIAGCRKRLYRITNPTLLVWGDDDR